MMTNKKGFTLIELLVVLAIVAILSVVVILTLNPAELLKQARDSNRLSDLGTLKSAISLYLADVATPHLADAGGGTDNFLKCWRSDTTFATSSAGCGNVFTAANYLAVNVTTSTAANNRTIIGAGWIPIKFTDISSGAPFGNLPVDPLNNTGGNYYAYAATATNNGFKISTVLESAKYLGLMTTDGGSGGTATNSFYDSGTNLGL